MDKVKCLICGRIFKYIPNHLRRTHNISIDEYLSEFPNAEIGLNPMQREENKAKFRGKNNPMNKPGVREKQLESVRTKEYKEKKSKIHKEMWADEDFREGVSQSHKEWWAKEENREKRRIAFTNPETIIKRSEAGKKCWADDSFVQKQMIARHVKQNKKERELQRFLDAILPNEYKFVGDGEFIIAGKCPDFVNINGKKKIIELFGLYWHRNDNPQDRIDLFKQYGYDTLIIWENELNSPEDLINALLQFHDLESLSASKQLTFI